MQLYTQLATSTGNFTLNPKKSCSCFQQGLLIVTPELETLKILMAHTQYDSFLLQFIELAVLPLKHFLPCCQGGKNGFRLASKHPVVFTVNVNVGIEVLWVIWVHNAQARRGAVAQRENHCRPEHKERHCTYRLGYRSSKAMKNHLQLGGFQKPK